MMSAGVLSREGGSSPETASSRLFHEFQPPALAPVRIAERQRTGKKDAVKDGESHFYSPNSYAKKFPYVTGKEALPERAP